jgi:hypothetical protein
VAIFSSTWIDPAGRWIGSPKDPRLFIWYLGWIPHQLSHGLNPLFTDHLSYPMGVNLMWNTSIIFPAVVLWPVTSLWGPVVSYNLLVTGGIALSAWCGFLAARRFIDSDLPCLLAGLIYGFSPALLAQAVSHAHVSVSVFPPVALILGHEILVRRRLNPVVAGALAGVAAAVQLLTGEELLAVTLLIAAFGILLLALLHRDKVRASVPYAARAGLAALFVFAVLAAYPLGFQFFGPQRVWGNVQGPDIYVSDLLAFFVPSSLIHFTGNAAENDAYVGIPLLALFAAGLVAGWRTSRIRWVGLTAIVVAVMSLRPAPARQQSVTSVPPWAVVAHLPLMGSALPGRLMAIGFLGIASWSPTRSAQRVAGASGPLLLLLAGLVVILPPIPYPSVAATVPAFFKPGGDVEKIPTGSVVLVTPFSSKESTDAMYWQATAGYRFRMPEGDAFTPGPYLGPHPSFLKSVLDQLDSGHAIGVTLDVRNRALADMRSFGVTTIVAGPSAGQAAIVDFLTQIEGRPPVEDGGVEVWWTFSS